MPEPVGARLRRPAPESRPRAADLAAWAVLTGVIAVELAGLRAAPAAEAVGMGLLLAVAFGIGRARPFTALGLALAAGVLHTAAAILGAADTLALSAVLPCAVLAFLAGRRSERTAPAVVLTTTAALTLLLVSAVQWVGLGNPREALTGLTDWAGGVLTLVAVVVAPWLLGRYWRLYAEMRTGGWEIADRMERARDADAAHARLRERSRIATEMHDSLGHDLALIAVRAAALEMAADGQDPRPAAAELRTSAHQANLRLREIIGVLRADSGEHAAEPPAEDVAAVVDRAVGAGMPVRLVREGPDPAPGSPAGRAAHRVVQEALTNAARHAPGTRVAVRLVTEDGTTAVDVRDTGPVAAARRDGTGNGSGLAGLRTLVEGMGGTFRAGPDGGGFTVRAVLPGGAGTAADGEPAAPHGPPADTTDTTETARSWRRVRTRSRRRLAAAVVLPLGLAGAITALIFLLLWSVAALTVLPRADYARLSVGDDRDAVRRVLPVFDYRPGPIPGEPPAPHGSECEYYLVTDSQGRHPVYRLCFADGRLAAKDEIARQPAGTGR
ncbi:signal transduction histidine kinase [Murinocardiopsis flavida]|uniref:histidine kinase n=1 Tax=Murinocardiopsis flavida TaxID=645275 RepID=A0A2P8DDT2_9ACTN|nr:ATP-binding protein [Murinocardiopsis flavida]PSK95384.1 signal transduction histidine kinase [Murinocardiopsis flavida]